VLEREIGLGAFLGQLEVEMGRLVALGASYKLLKVLITHNVV
jgi:hypothetical protein